MAGERCYQQPLRQRPKQHVPRVIVVSPEPDDHGFTPAIFSRVLVDGQEWMAVDYTIKGKVDGYQQVTLTFLADVTVERP